ncbi:MAG: lipopolysaccharide biosynthesis protein [Gemmatimonadaceae bacterium]
MREPSERGLAAVLLLGHVMSDPPNVVATAPPHPPRHRSVLDRALLSGVAWTAGVKWGTQILSWAATLVVARLLTPADYGLFGMAMVFQAFLGSIYDLGLASAIIQRRDLSEEQLARLGGLSMLYGVGFAVLTVALAGPIARFYREPAVEWILLVLAGASLIDALQIMPRAVLARDLQFRKIALIDGFSALVLTAATLGFAFAGFRYRALVYGHVVDAVLSTVLALVVAPHRFSWPRRATGIGGAMTYGWQVALSRIAAYVAANADFAVVGRVLGKAPLGAYTFGWTIATIPVDRIASLVARVIPSVFSPIQRDPAAMRRYWLGVTEGLAFVVLPAAVGLAVTADDFVRVVLGERWEPAIAPLRLLALYGGIRALTAVVSPILVATGHAKRNLQFTLLAAAVLPLLFYLGTRWGTVGVAAAWIVGFPAVSLPAFVFTLRLLQTRPGAYLRAVSPALTATAAMAVTLVAIRLLTPALPTGTRFALQVISGAVTYGAIVLAFHRPRIDAFRGLLRNARVAEAGD